jgi:hypothetical protein
MHHVETLETELAAAAAEVRPRTSNASLNSMSMFKDMSRPKGILAAGIFNEGFNDDERAAGREGGVSRADEVYLFFEDGIAGRTTDKNATKYPRREAS